MLHNFVVQSAVLRHTLHTCTSSKDVGLLAVESDYVANCSWHTCPTVVGGKDFLASLQGAPQSSKTHAGRERIADHKRFSVIILDCAMVPLVVHMLELWLSRLHLLMCHDWTTVACTGSRAA